MKTQQPSQQHSRGKTIVTAHGERIVIHAPVPPVIFAKPIVVEPPPASKPSPPPLPEKGTSPTEEKDTTTRTPTPPLHTLNPTLSDDARILYNETPTPKPLFTQEIPVVKNVNIQSQSSDILSSKPILIGRDVPFIKTGIIHTSGVLPSPKQMSSAPPSNHAPSSRPAKPPVSQEEKTKSCTPCGLGLGTFSNWTQVPLTLETCQQVQEAWQQRVRFAESKKSQLSSLERMYLQADIDRWTEVKQQLLERIQNQCETKRQLLFFLQQDQRGEVQPIREALELLELGMSLLKPPDCNEDGDSLP